MKRFIRILTVLILAVAAVTFTGCSQKKQYTLETVEFSVDSTVDSIDKEGYTFVGLYQLDKKSKKATLYREGSTAPAGSYQIIYIEKSKVDLNGKYSFPALVENGLTFAGWYSTENLKQGTRVTTTDTTTENIIYARFITFGDASLVTLVCIIIVFLMLALLWGIVALLKYIAPKEKQAQQPDVAKDEKALTIEDIKDDDMMAAALVATIDYHEETGENVRVVSIKEIK